MTFGEQSGLQWRKFLSPNKEYGGAFIKSAQQGNEIAMELKRYLNTLFQWWWLGLITFIVTLLATLIFTYGQVPVYESTTTLVVSPNAMISTDLGELRAAVTSLDKPIVANTYAEIGQSDSVINAAMSHLGVRPSRDYAVGSSVLQETNIIKITVTGPEPMMVQKLAAAVADQTLDYVSELFEVYDLIKLDPASLPSEPSTPNVNLNLLVGASLGVGLAVILVFLAEYLRQSQGQIDSTTPVDFQTGALKPSYFIQRMREEISRSERQGHSFSVGLVQLADLEQSVQGLSANTVIVILRRAVGLIQQTLPADYLISILRDNSLLLLMPDTDKDLAADMLKKVKTKINWATFEVDETGMKLHFDANCGVATYSADGIEPENLIRAAAKALADTSEAGESVG